MTTDWVAVPANTEFGFKFIQAVAGYYQGQCEVRRKTILSEGQRIEIRFDWRPLDRVCRVLMLDAAGIPLPDAPLLPYSGPECKR